jgi:hypothetical protein
MHKTFLVYFPYFVKYRLTNSSSCLCPTNNWRYACTLKAGIVEPEEVAVARQRLDEHVLAAHNL